MKKKLILLLMVMLFVLSGCMGSDEKIEVKDKSHIPTGGEQNKTSVKKTVGNSTWIAYWDTKTAKEELSGIKKMDQIVNFGVYFNEQNQFVIPDCVRNPIVKGKANYVSFINDLVKSDGTSSLKDVNLTETLIGEETARKSHIEDIINLAKKLKYDGIEIDYEAINNGNNLWQSFVDFINELYKGCLKEKLDLRVVLEPSIPYDKIVFPDGPEYVIMCYNLYGPHSTEPGPKADIAFIKKMLEKTKSINRRVMAVANGGYDWCGNDMKSVTERSVSTLIDTYHVKPVRDEKNQALHFTYSKDGEEHTVWYADKVTLTVWKKLIKNNKSVGFALWRVGGNTKETMTEVLK